MLKVWGILNDIEIPICVDTTVEVNATSPMLVSTAVNVNERITPTLEQLMAELPGLAWPAKE